MLAVALYAVPGAYSNTSVVQFLRHHVNDSTRPYILATSLWQSWPLFAPDPTRRVTRLYMETRNSEKKWTTEPAMGYDSVRWWRSAKEVKIIDRLRENSREEIRDRYVQLQCKRAGITERIAVRSKYKYYVIPKHDMQKTVRWWKDWQPEWHEKVDRYVLCNPYSA